MRVSNDKPSRMPRGGPSAYKWLLLIAIPVLIAIGVIHALMPSQADPIDGIGGGYAGGWGTGGYDGVYLGAYVLDGKDYPQGTEWDSMLFMQERLINQISNALGAQCSGGTLRNPRTTDSANRFNNKFTSAYNQAMSHLTSGHKRVVGIAMTAMRSNGWYNTGTVPVEQLRSALRNAWNSAYGGWSNGDAWNGAYAGTTYGQAMVTQYIDTATEGTQIIVLVADDSFPAPAKSISATTNVSGPANPKSDSADPVHDTVHVSSQNLSGNSETSFRLHYNSAQNYTGTVDTAQTGLKTATGGNNASYNSPNFTPSDFGWSTWKSGTYWFTAWARCDGVEGGQSGNDPNERFIVTEASYTPTSATLHVNKSLTGENLSAGQFTFVLRENGTQIQTARNDANGNVYFTVSYNGKGDVGTHTYTITEQNDGRAKYTYDTHTVTARVSVTENNYRMSASTPTYSGGTTFNNTRLPDLEPTSVTLNVRKVLNKDALRNGQFTFICTENGYSVGRATNDANGNVTFRINYNSTSDCGTHTYQIREQNGGDSDIEYDTHVVTATVTVSQSTRTAKDGTSTIVLSTSTPTYSGDTTFVNTHHQHGTIQLHAKKTFVDGSIKSGQFTFELLDSGGKVIDTRTNDASGMVTFKTLSYTEDDIGNHTYQIREVAGNDEGIAYDTEPRTVTVNVGASDTPQLRMSSSPALSMFNDASMNAEFVNRVQATNGKVELDGTKKMVGRDLFGGDFEFVLKDENGNEIGKAKNDRDGKFSFIVELTRADLGKTRTLTITETKGDNKWITYDDHVETVTLTNIRDERKPDASHVIAANVNYDNDGMTFTNTLPPMATTGGNGKNDMPAIIIGTASAVSAIGLVGVGIHHRRNKNAK